MNIAQCDTCGLHTEVEVRLTCDSCDSKPPQDRVRELESKLRNMERAALDAKGVRDRRIADEEKLINIFATAWRDCQLDLADAQRAGVLALAEHLRREHCLVTRALDAGLHIKISPTITREGMADFSVRTCW